MSIRIILEAPTPTSRYSRGPKALEDRAASCASYSNKLPVPSSLSFVRSYHVVATPFLATQGMVRSLVPAEGLAPSASVLSGLCTSICAPQAKLVRTANFEIAASPFRTERSASELRPVNKVRPTRTPISQ